MNRVKPMNGKSSLAWLIRGLSGKKTYLIGIAGIVYSLGISRNWWPNDAAIWGALGSAGAITLRAAVTKLITQFLDDLTTASATPPASTPPATTTKP